MSWINEDNYPENKTYRTNSTTKAEINNDLNIVLNQVVKMKEKDFAADAKSIMLFANATNGYLGIYFYDEVEMVEVGHSSYSLELPKLWNISLEHELGAVYFDDLTEESVKEFFQSKNGTLFTENYKIIFSNELGDEIELTTDKITSEKVNIEGLWKINSWRIRYACHHPDILPDTDSSDWQDISIESNEAKGLLLEFGLGRNLNSKSLIKNIAFEFSENALSPYWFEFKILDKDETIKTGSWNYNTEESSNLSISIPGVDYPLDCNIEEENEKGILIRERFYSSESDGYYHFILLEKIVKKEKQVETVATEPKPVNREPKVTKKAVKKSFWSRLFSKS